MEPLCRPRGGVAQIPVPAAAAPRGRGVDRLPDGPRETADARPDRGARLPGALPRAAAPVRRPPADRHHHLHHQRRLLLHAAHPGHPRLPVCRRLHRLHHHLLVVIALSQHLLLRRRHDNIPLLTLRCYPWLQSRAHTNADSILELHAVW